MDIFIKLYTAQREKERENKKKEQEPTVIILISRAPSPSIIFAGDDLLQSKQNKYKKRGRIQRLTRAERDHLQESKWGRRWNASVCLCVGNNHHRTSSVIGVRIIIIIIIREVERDRDESHSCWLDSSETKGDLLLLQLMTNETTGTAKKCHRKKKREKEKRTQNDRVTGRARGRQQKYKDKEEMVSFFSINQRRVLLIGHWRCVSPLSNCVYRKNWGGGRDIFSISVYNIIIIYI